MNLSFVLKVFVVLGLITTAKAGNSDESSFDALINHATQECLKIEKVTEEELEPFFGAEGKADYKAKCFIACTYEEFGIVRTSLF